MSNDVTYWKQGMCVRILEAMRADGDIEQVSGFLLRCFSRFPNSSNPL